MNTQPRQRREQGKSRQGYTLLELLLALALSTMIIYAVVWSIQLHLHSLDIRRTSIEEAQVARALMKIITDDLRGAVQHREQDYSGVQDVLANALSQSAEELAAEAGLLLDDLGGAVDGTDGGGAAGGGGATGGAGGGTGGAGGGAGGAGGAGEPTDDTGEAADDALLEDDTVDLSYTADIADGGLIPPVVGLYGNATQIQIDVSRIQRVDELYTSTAATMAATPQSDIRSTSYYIRGLNQPTNPSVAGGAAPAAGGLAQRGGGLTGGVPFDAFGATGGLIRRSVTRSAAMYESNNGASLAGAFDGKTREDIVAPECVAIQFEYFDGFEWAAEWDSVLKGGLPFAVAVQVTLQSDNRTANMPDDAPPEMLVFRQVISIPTAEPISPEAEEDILEELQGTGGEASE